MSAISAILKESFEAIEPVLDPVVDRFVVELTKRYPESRQAFPRLSDPAVRLAIKQALNLAMSSYGQGEKFPLALRILSLRCAHLRPSPAHCEWAVESFVGALQYFFDQSWSAELESEWRKLLNQSAQAVLASPELLDAKVAATSETASSPAVVSSPSNPSSAAGVVAPDSSPHKAVQEQLRVEIDAGLRDLVQNVLGEVMLRPEIRQLVSSLATAMLHEVLQEKVAELRQTFSSRKAA